jgi:hypothetical protein
MNANPNTSFAFKITQQIESRKSQKEKTEMTSASGIKNALLSEVAPAVKDSENKVTIVGVGQVGMACTFSVLAQVLGRY